jgi:hypothetical protein
MIYKWQSFTEKSRTGFVKTRELARDTAAQCKYLTFTPDDDV